jgi:superfamily II DNA or RNA helicase
MEIAPGFTSLLLKDSYTTSQDSMVDDFYLPCLRIANQYDRAVGYFSSAIFILISESLLPFIENGGKMRLICSPELSNEDAIAIKEGSKKIGDIAAERLLNELENWDSSFGKKVPSSLLRGLVASGILEIRIAVPTIGSGIYHPKLGIFSDQSGRMISFNGSANETMRGWADAGNHEYFDVFCDWKSTDDEIRVRNHRKRFEETWLGLVSGLRILKSSDLEKVFVPRETDLPFEQCLQIIRERRKTNNKLTDQDIPSNQNLRVLQDHQKDVLENWKLNDHKGVISFVTGGGKTVTALRAAKYWLDLKRPVIILVPSKLLHEQWQEEIAIELEPYGYNPILIGNGANRNIWKTAIQSIFSQNSTGIPALFLATYQTAKKYDFLSLIKNHSELLVIADEAHRLGAPDTRNILNSLPAAGRLGLSATYERFGDEEGTLELERYFQRILEPVFSISDAIKAKRLVPYSYEFEIAELNEEEEEKFDEFTANLVRSLDWANGAPISTPFSQHWARQRANIVKECVDKDRVAIELLKNCRKSDRWLVYCNSINHVNRLHIKLRELGIDSLVYHSNMSGDRKSTLDYFERQGGILLSIKCLDEGVDIPKLDRALILASSTNPREYIQRRGRALRVAPGKYQAWLYDVVVVKRNGQPALFTDVDRSESFAASAANLYAQTRLRELRRMWEIYNEGNGLRLEENYEDENADTNHKEEEE